MGSLVQGIPILSGLARKGPILSGNRLTHLTHLKPKKDPCPSLLDTHIRENLVWSRPPGGPTYSQLTKTAKTAKLLGITFEDKTHFLLLYQGLQAPYFHTTTDLTGIVIGLHGSSLILRLVLSIIDCRFKDRHGVLTREWVHCRTFNDHDAFIALIYV